MNTICRKPHQRLHCHSEKNEGSYEDRFLKIEMHTNKDLSAQIHSSRLLLVSISSRFVRPRSFAHTTAGSLCPIVFSTNQRLARTNRAGRSLNGQFSLVIDKDGGNLQRFLLFEKFVSELSEDGKFGKRHQGAIAKLFNGQDVYYHGQRDHKSLYFLVCCSTVTAIWNLMLSGKSTAFHGLDYLSPHFVGARSVRILYMSVGNGAVFVGVCDE